MSPLDTRFMMEFLSQSSVSPVVGFRCGMLSPTPVEAEGKDRGRMGFGDESVYGDTLLM